MVTDVLEHQQQKSSSLKKKEVEQGQTRQSNPSSTHRSEAGQEEGITDRRQKVRAQVARIVHCRTMVRKERNEKGTKRGRSGTPTPSFQEQKPTPFRV